MLHRAIALSGLVAAASLASPLAIAQGQRPEVTIDAGTLVGTVGESSIRVFKGIPYATPPVGNLRWREPQPVAAWSGPKDAGQYGDRCQQTLFVAYSPVGNRGMSENCLFLNVWAAPSSEKRPVLVWIHGGGFGYGYANQASYDGAHFAEKGLVFVNLNYRVGAFGFLAHPDLTQESPNKSSGNYGLLDQIAALQWIKRNIAAFGGDPDNVTIFGESAGSISVNVLTASPLAKGLFKRAIGASGAGLGTTVDTLPVRPLAVQEERGKTFANILRVRSAAELRAVPAAEIADVGENGRGNLFNASRYAPNIDGYLLKEAPAQTYAKGEQNNVELIAGWNLHEGRTFMRGSGVASCKPAWNSTLKPETFIKQANQSFGADAKAFLSLYPHATDSEAAASAETVVGDVVVTWATWKWADLQTRSGKTKAYVYMFGKVPPAEFPLRGATHGAEIPYAFDNLQAFKASWDAMDTQLARTMSAYYVNFAKTGDPNGSGLPAWPVYRPDEPQRMVLNEGGAVSQSLSLAKFNLIDANPSAGPWCPEVK